MEASAVIVRILEVGVRFIESVICVACHPVNMKQACDEQASVLLQFGYNAKESFPQVPRRRAVAFFAQQDENAFVADTMGLGRQARPKSN
jgi:hypothetical protein